MIVTLYSNQDTIEWGVTGKERIVQNVRNIIRTRMYEVPFMRGMGINPDYIDSATSVVESELISQISEAITEYEDRADVLEAWIDSVDEKGEYIIAVKIEV